MLGLLAPLPMCSKAEGALLSSCSVATGVGGGVRERDTFAIAASFLRSSILDSSSSCLKSAFSACRAARECSECFAASFSIAILEIQVKLREDKSSASCSRSLIERSTVDVRVRQRV